MSKRNILVTGGAGFIGANFVHLVLAKHKDDRITVVDKLTYAGNLLNLDQWKQDSRLIFVRADITDKDAVQKLFSENEFTHVAHFAAESHVDRSILGPEAFVVTNVIGTFVLLEAARRNGWCENPGERKFLHVSTDEVFGSLGSSGFFTETTPYSPNSPYSASKAGSDHLVRAYHETYGLPAVISNCSNNYGPFQFPEKLIPLMILNCLAGKPLPVYGKGDNVRDWLYVEDHAQALDLILERADPGETFNIGGKNEWKNIDLVRTLCKIMDEKHSSGVPHENLIQFVKDRPGHDHRYAIDPSKLERTLGWTPAHRFEEGLAKTVQWYLDHKPWWEKILSGEYKDYYARQYSA